MGGSKAAGMKMPREQPQLPTIFQPAQPAAPATLGTPAPVAPDVRTARAECSPLTDTLLDWASEFVGHVTALLNPFLSFAERFLKRSANDARGILVLVEEGRANPKHDFEHHLGELTNLVAAAEQKTAGVAAVKEIGDAEWQRVLRSLFQLCRPSSSRIYLRQGTEITLDQSKLWCSTGTR